jgi:hypothetical protein
MAGSLNVLTSNEFKYTVVDLATDSTTITTAKAILRAIYINTTLSAHALVIKDNATTVFTIPAGTVAGTWVPFGDAYFSGGIVIDPDNSGTGNITVLWAKGAF